MNEVCALGYLGFGVSSLPAWTDYASGFLGLMAVPRDDGTVDLRMDAYASRIRLHEDPLDDLAYIGWEVAGPDALSGLEARLSSAGVPVRRGTAEEAADRRVEALILFDDIEGLASEAYFGALQRTDVPFQSPIGTRFTTGSQGLGHVVLTSKDRVAAERWYLDVLGLKLSDYVHVSPMPGFRIDLTFMRCNQRHHSLAIIGMPMPKRLQHFMLEVESMDDVGRSIYRSEAGSVHVSMTLGRHSNDDMVSVYYRTPSGFDVEVGWDGLLVDDGSWQVRSHDVPSAWGHRFQPSPL